MRVPGQTLLPTSFVALEESLFSLSLIYPSTQWTGLGWRRSFSHWVTISEKSDSRGLGLFCEGPRWVSSGLPESLWLLQPCHCKRQLCPLGTSSSLVPQPPWPHPTPPRAESSLPSPLSLRTLVCSSPQVGCPVVWALRFLGSPVTSFYSAPGFPSLFLALLRHMCAWVRCSRGAPNRI